MNVDASGTNSIALNTVSGKFVVDEPIKVNGVPNNLTITSITTNALRDIKSIFQNHNSQKFNADVVLSQAIKIAESDSAFGVEASTRGEYKSSLASGPLKTLAEQNIFSLLPALVKLCSSHAICPFC